MARRIYEDRVYDYSMADFVDGEWYRVKFSKDGEATFYLDIKESNLDLDLFIYEEEDHRSHCLGDSTRGKGKSERVRDVRVRAGRYYYIYVENINGRYGDFSLEIVNHPKQNNSGDFDYQFKSIESEEEKPFQLKERVNFDVDVENFGEDDGPVYKVLLKDRKGKEIDSDSEPELRSGESNYAHLSVKILEQDLNEKGNAEFTFSIESDDGDVFEEKTREFAVGKGGSSGAGGGIPLDEYCSVGYMELIESIKNEQGVIAALNLLKSDYEVAAPTSALKTKFRRNYRDNYERYQNELKYFNGKLRFIAETAKIAEHVYDYNSNKVGLIGGWKFIEGEDIGSLRIGKYYRRLSNGRKEYVFANAGTSDLADWIENGKQPFGDSHDVELSIDKAINFANEHKYERVIFVGHSKGGAEATANAIATDKEAIIFNPAMLNPFGYEKLHVRNEMRKKINAYVVRGEALDEVYKHTSSYTLSKMYQPEQASYTKKSYLNTFYPVNTGNDKLNKINAVKNHSMEAVIGSIEQARNK